MRRFLLLVFVSMTLSCSESPEDEIRKFDVTDVLYEEDDIARVSFNSTTNEYLLFFHRKDSVGRNIDNGPFVYKVMDRNFREIRTGEFGSERNDGYELRYTIQFLPLGDTLLSGSHKLLKDNKIMQVIYNSVNILDSHYNLLHAIVLPQKFGDYTETDELTAFTFDFSYSAPLSENSVICVVYNKTTQEIENYQYKFDSGLEEKVNSDGDFAIAHNLEQELILASPKGVYKLVNGKWQSYLNEYLYNGRLTNVTSLYVDFDNRLFTYVDGNTEIYDLQNENFIAKLNSPLQLVGVHPDGDMIIFHHPFFASSDEPKLYKLRIH